MRRRKNTVTKKELAMSDHTTTEEHPDINQVGFPLAVAVVFLLVMVANLFLG